jgi:uncharacterized membrane protein YbaN (DUF454 family)
MNNQEAKLILQAYRPGGQDASDPMFAEALEQARRDPELQKWFAEECAYDARIQSKLKEAIPIPPDLKASLLAQRKIVRPAAWWRQPMWQTTAVAAALVLLASLTVFWLRPSGQPQFAAFRQAMVRNSLREANHVSFMAQDMTQARDWLKTQNVSGDFDLPAALRGGMLHGCKVIDWHRQKVTMLCFMSSGGGHVDLFVVNCTHFRDFTPRPTAQFARSDGLTTAVWCNGDKTYLLAAHLNEQQVRKIL